MTCWFCRGCPTHGLTDYLARTTPVCADCIAELDGLSAYLARFDGLFIVTNLTAASERARRPSG